METLKETGPSLTLSEFGGIVRYCSEEVNRQQRGPLQVSNMVDAWIDAITHQYHGDDITVEMIERWGMMIEPAVNSTGFRTIPIYVGWEEKLNWRLVRRAMEKLVENLNEYEALAAYREFENIHPFEDGNGRTGKIILNWINGTLINPVFPPKDFWGQITNNP